MKHERIGVVDHRRPIHDSYCRCRICKPPLVGARMSRPLRATIIVAAAIAVWAAVSAIILSI